MKLTTITTREERTKKRGTRKIRADDGGREPTGERKRTSTETGRMRTETGRTRAEQRSWGRVEGPAEAKGEDEGGQERTDSWKGDGRGYER